MEDNKEFLVDTDILVEHLKHSDKSTLSCLEKAMTCGICFTTVLNSAEIYFVNGGKQNRLAVDNLMKAVKVMGMHARYSLYVPEFIEKAANLRDALICASAKLNNLPILTLQPEKYSNSGVKVIHPDEL